MKKKNFNEKLYETASLLYQRMSNLAISRFEWEGVPEEIDIRFIEVGLLDYGTLAFFKDPDIGYICLPYTFDQNFNIYGNPNGVRAYSGYTNYSYKPDKYVILWDNMIRRPPQPTLWQFASRMADCVLTAGVNIKAQKTPMIVKTDDKGRVTLENIYEAYEGNHPVIFATRGIDLANQLEVYKTDAPYVADKIMEQYNIIWSEMLTFLGIPNVSSVSGSRKVADEVLRSQGGAVASRFSPDFTRQQAVKQINKMFGLNVRCHLKADFDQLYLHQGMDGSGIGENAPDKYDTGGALNE
ncbi:MAG: hypothetical protein NC116_12255 [Clostridium sp.]|nr:hypothetical protein [Clostridium sp.]